MDRKEIMSEFDQLGFKDKDGNSLCDCMAFQMLVDQAIEDSQRVRFLERRLCREASRNL